MFWVLSSAGSSQRWWLASSPLLGDIWTWMTHQLLQSTVSTASSIGAFLHGRFPSSYCVYRVKSSHPLSEWGLREKALPATSFFHEVSVFALPMGFIFCFRSLLVPEDPLSSFSSSFFYTPVFGHPILERPFLCCSHSTIFMEVPIYYLTFRVLETFA